MKKRGFTLLEAVLYLAIAGVVIYFISGFAFNAIFGKAKIESIQEVSEGSRSVLDQISSAISNSSEINGLEVDVPPGETVPWYDVSWIYRKKITIDKTKVPNTDQTNFPVLVSLTGLSNINANGTDIRFTDSTGTGELAREIESYSAGTLVAWVKVPVLSTSANTDIYMYYGSTGASEPSPRSAYGSQKVWDDGGSNYFKGVWHLADPTNPVDSTDANNGTNSGSTATVGQVDGGAYFTSANYISLGASNLFTPTTASTLSFWVKTSNTHYQRLFVFERASGSSAMALNIAVSTGAGDDNNGKPYAFYRNSSDILLSMIGPSSIADGNWHYLSYTINNTVGSLYVDGISAATASDISVSKTFNFSSDNALINYFTSNGLNPGYLDESRFSNTARSADWIKTEYNNQSSPATFYTVGSEETP